MQIGILGATGRTGRWLLKEALEANHYVRVLVRNPENIPEDIRTNKNLEVRTSELLTRHDLRGFVSGCDAILNTLNISRTSDFPWAQLRTPKDLLSRVASDLVAISSEVGPKRFITTSAWGVGDSRADIPWWFRWLIDSSNIGPAYEDHARQEQIWRSSKLDYTIIQPVGLTNGRAREVVVSHRNNPKPNLTVSRASVARHMLSIIDKESTYRTTYVVS